MQYTLFNSGSVQLGWALISNTAWISVNPYSGSIPPQSTGSVSVSINPNANTFPAGNYTASLQFVNNSTHEITSRLVSLVIAPAPGTLIVTPSATVTFAGQTGGPFALIPTPTSSSVLS